MWLQDVEQNVGNWTFDTVVIVQWINFRLLIMEKDTQQTILQYIERGNLFM